MATIKALPKRSDAVSFPAAVAAFVDTHARPEAVGTRRTYTEILGHLLAAGSVDVLDTPAGAEALGAWFRQRWGSAAPATWNRNLACLRSACAYWRTQHWIITDPLAGLAHAKVRENRSRVRSRTAIADLLARGDLPLRERTL